MTSPDESTHLLPTGSKKPGKPLLPFILAISCCLCAGSISIFSLYTTPFRSTLGLTQYQINAIAISAELGMYFPVPLIGYFGDKYGQSILAMLSIVLFAPAYFVSAWVYTNGSPSIDTTITNAHIYLSICFCSIGCATSALYMSCLTSCARMLPKNTGLAISAPVAAFGISSLWQSQLLPKIFGHSKKTGLLNIESILIFYGFLYILTGLVATAAIKIARVDHVEDLDVGRNHSILDEEAESEVVLTNEPSQKERFILFLLNHETWILLAAFVLLSGPLEMYLNNIGALLSSIPPDGADGFTSSHVSAFAMASTAARLVMGVGSDWARPVISTATLLTVIAIFGGVAQVLLALGYFMHEGSTLLISVIPTLICGFSYGAIFTLYPTMIAKVWGVKSFGTNWGLFIIAPALGSLIFSLLFASVYEEYGSDVGVCIGSECYEWTFILTGTGFFCAAIFVFALWHYRWKLAAIDL